MVAQNYDGPTYVWNTAGLAAGTYNIDVWVRQAGSGAAYQSFAVISYVVGPSVACASAGLSPDKASPQARGTTVTFTATSTMCSQPQYLFYIQSPSGVWTVVQNYDGPTFVWNTTGLAPGTYNVDVWVKQNGSSNLHETFTLVAFTLT